MSQNQQQNQVDIYITFKNDKTPVEFSHAQGLQNDDRYIRVLTSDNEIFMYSHDSVESVHLAPCAVQAVNPIVTP